jgi:hypothetical protein
MRDLINTRDGATYIAGRVWGIHMHYDLANDHPLTGRSVPNFTFEDGTTIGGLMRNGKGILLDLNMNASLKALAGKYDDQLRYISATVKDLTGVSALLIRPDGIVAWAARHATDCSGAQNAAACWFVYN